MVFTQSLFWYQFHTLEGLLSSHQLAQDNSWGRTPGQTLTPQVVQGIQKHQLIKLLNWAL